MKAIYGKAFRAPTFLELYDQTNLGPNGIRGNQTLAPETINNVELEVGYVKKSVLLRAVGYYYQIDNLIRAYDPHGRGATGYWENTGNISTYGVEGEITYSTSKILSLFVNAAFYQEVFEWNTDKVIPI